MPRGGRRVGAGRKKGSLSLTGFGGVHFQRTLQSYQRRFKTHPLDLLLAIINDEVRGKDGKPTELPVALKLEAAKAAAPYLHRKLPQAVELDGTDGGPIRYSMDLTKLTDEELMALERMLIKAQRPMLPLLDLDAEEDENGSLQ